MQSQSCKKMDGEQIKNKVLNASDRRKKIENSISKYSRERNQNAYEDQITEQQKNMTQSI